MWGFINKSLDLYALLEATFFLYIHFGGGNIEWYEQEHGRSLHLSCMIIPYTTSGLTCIVLRSNYLVSIFGDFGGGECVVEETHSCAEAQYKGLEAIAIYFSMYWDFIR